MLNRIFGNKKDKLIDMMVYWKDDVNMDDLMDDLSVLGELVNKPKNQKDGCKIVTVRTWLINDTKYKTCELVVNKELNKYIENTKRFKAVNHTETIIG